MPVKRAALVKIFPDEPINSILDIYILRRKNYRQVYVPLLPTLTRGGVKHGGYLSIYQLQPQRRVLAPSTATVSSCTERAGKPHAGICAGAVGQLAVLPLRHARVPLLGHMTLAALHNCIGGVSGFPPGTNSIVYNTNRALEGPVTP